MDFLKGSTQKDAKLREEMSILATTIESINQRLNTGGKDFDLSIARAIKMIDKKLAYLYEQIKQTEKEVNSNIKTVISGEVQSLKGELRKDHTAMTESINARIEGVEKSMKTVVSGEIRSLKGELRKDHSAMTESINNRLDVIDKKNQKIMKELFDNIAESQTLLTANLEKANESTERFERIERQLSLMNERWSAIIDLYRIEIKVLKEHNHILKKKFELPFGEDDFDDIDPGRIA
ncbi:MAG: hypothetical protein ACMXYL_05140 [Candidatus Woesearchaeota archaeon]